MWMQGKEPTLEDAKELCAAVERTVVKPPVIRRTREIKNGGTMKAKIVDNLLDTIEDFFGPEEGHRKDPAFLALCDRIQGKEVDLRFVGPDAFEAIDNNFWLPNCCWTSIE